MALLMCISVGAQKRKMVSVIDIDTRKPIERVAVVHGNDTIAYSTPQGLVVIPEVEGTVVFSYMEYKSKEYDYAQLPPVVRMKSTTQMVDEVFVTGHQQKKVNEDAVNIGTSEFGVVKTTTSGSSINISDAYNKTIGKTPKERKKEKLQETLEEY